MTDNSLEHPGLYRLSWII